ncbi:MAG: hypothetical protein ABI741_12895 [Ferruginibacter sp.]
MKFFTALVFLLSFQLFSFAQKISKTDQKILFQKEDSLKTHAWKIIEGINASDRFKADSIFTKIFVRALAVKNSFYHPFDSLLTISRLYAPDSSFRVFTWQMVINENIIRQHGAIQLRTADGSLKLFPLIDKSDVTVNVADTVGNNLGWMGAVYYRIILTKNLGHKYYTLLGFDENNIRSNKKVIEVLDFVNGQPMFGGRFFSIPSGTLIAHNPSRYIMEYKKESAAKLNYEDDLGLIIAEHLVSESKEPQKKWTYITDGDFEGFQWMNGKWVFINNVRNYKTRDPNVPLEKTIRDEKGNIDYDKLKSTENEPDSITKPKKKDN